ncbi:MAG: arylsulfatase [Prolixibacteraceae bacterium]
MKTTFRKLTFLFMAIIVFSGCQNKSSDNETTAEQKPNIIFILADDLGYGDIEPYGQEMIKTPQLGKMAAEGIKFTQHYAGNTVCAPSRCALMTGLHMGHAEVRGNKQAEPSGQLPLSDEAVTVAELMKDAGYNTGMIGKWGLGVEGTPGEPTNQGFDYYYGYLDQILAHNYYPEYLLRNGEKEILDNEVKYLPEEEWHGGLGSYATKKVDYTHDLFEEDALRFIEANKGNPFFLYLPFTIPHNNGEAPVGEKMEIPDYGIYKDKEWHSDTMGHAAMITRMDETIGKIFDKLNETGLDENTLVLFTSDNGPMQEDNVGFTRFFDSNSFLRGGKRDLYDGGIRVPFIARWPGKIAEGKTSEHISAFWDFMPTACEVAGIEVPKNTDGISYLPELLGNNEEQEKHSHLYWEFYGNWDAQAVRKDNWKAVKNIYQDGEIELYNLANDPDESNNVASKHPEIVEQMDSLMSASRVPSEHFSF